jgi:hypothetical protein
VPIEVVGRDELLEGDGDRFVEAAGFCGAEHDALRDAVDSGKARSLPLAGPQRAAFFNTQRRYRNQRA